MSALPHQECSGQEFYLVERGGESRARDCVELNDNFIILVIKGILNMLHGASC
jgi:hypothetical protein